jgi:hypothetical protein
MAAIDGIRKLDELLANLEALSEGFDTGVVPEQCIRRLVDAIEEGPARKAAEEELSLLHTALTNSISPLLRRAVAVVSRASAANNLDQLARIAAFREPLLKGIAATTPRRLIGPRLEDRLRGKLIRAGYAAALISAATDRIEAEGGLPDLKRSIEALSEAGAQVAGFGLPLPNFSIWDNTASAFLMILVQFSLALHAGRRLDERRGDDDGDSNNDDRPLDDRLEPKPWAHPQGSTDVRELLDIRLPDAEGDCWLRARSGAARFFYGVGLLSTTKFLAVCAEIEAAGNPDLRQELTKARAAFLLEMDTTPDSTNLRLPQASSTPSTEDRCRDCECDACPMRPRT